MFFSTSIFQQVSVLLHIFCNDIYLFFKALIHGFSIYFVISVFFNSSLPRSFIFDVTWYVSFVCHPTVDISSILLQDYIFVKADEYALVSHKKLQKESRREGEVTRDDKDEYDVGLVITHDNPKGILQSESEVMTLRLKYFIILTRSRDCFPMKTLEKKFGEFRSTLTRTSSHSECIETADGLEFNLYIVLLCVCVRNERGKG